MSPKDTAATKQQRAVGSRGPCSRRNFILPEPFGIVTPCDTASQMQTRSLSPGTAYRRTSWDEVQLYFFFPFSLICPRGLGQNFNLESVLPLTLPPFEVPVSDTPESYLACTHKDCKQSGYAGIDTYPCLHSNNFFTCFHHLLKKRIAQQQCRCTDTVAR